MPRDDLIPSQKRIFRCIEQVFAQGVRRPGYPADRWEEQYCLEHFQGFGLEDVRLEPVDLPFWEPRRWSLTVERQDPGGTVDLACFPLPHSAPTSGLEAPLVVLEDQSPDQVRGRIALDDLPLTRPRHAALAERAIWCYDPDSTRRKSLI